MRPPWPVTVTNSFNQVSVTKRVTQLYCWSHTVYCLCMHSGLGWSQSGNNINLTIFTEYIGLLSVVLPLLFHLRFECILFIIIVIYLQLHNYGPYSINSLRWSHGLDKDFTLVHVVWSNSYLQHILIITVTYSQIPSTLVVSHGLDIDFTLVHAVWLLAIFNTSHIFFYY